MKTTYTIMVILISVLFTQTAAAKLGTNRSSIEDESKIEINIQTEIINNIHMMLANLQTPTIKADASKQLDIGTVQLQTNELVQNLANKLPEFKFKVVITD